MATDFQYDVFLSHSSKDKAVVRPLAERLRADGLKVWFDEWVLKPGDSIPAKIEEGLEHSRVLVLCMSVNAFGSDWTQLEADTFRFRDPLNKERRFIPLRLDDTPIKGSLAQFLYINWRPADHEQQYVKLVEACAPPLIKSDAWRPLKSRWKRGKDLVRPVKLICFSNSVRDDDGLFSYELRLEATNIGPQTFGWSGLSICIPTIGDKSLDRTAKFELKRESSGSGEVYGPGDKIWGFDNRGVWRPFPAKYVLVENVINFWQPKRPIELGVAFRISCPMIRIGLRAWACDDRDSQSAVVVGDPSWGSRKRRDQQGIPSYWYSFGIRNNSVRKRK